MRRIAMQSNNIINVVLASADIDVANSLLKSMHQALPSFEIKASILLFGITEPRKIYQFCRPVEIIDIVTYYPPIVDSRNICQAHLRRKMNEFGGIGFILDDDLSWTLPENEFITVLEKLKKAGCDMAFSALSGDSPIPKEYTRTSPLLDVLIAIAVQYNDSKAMKIKEYVTKVDISEKIESNINTHHDFYTFTHKKFHKYDVDIATINWHDFIDRLVKGKSTTRTTPTPITITPAKGRERGGATLILNVDVLLCKNDAMRYLNLYSRRSDMIMATDAANYNFKLFNTPPMLKHLRDEAFDTHDSKKLIGDILGYALVESKEGANFCAKKFATNVSQRIEHTKFLLMESSKMMELLDLWLKNNNYIELDVSSLVKSMIAENEKTYLALTSIDLGVVNQSFNTFIYNRINYLKSDESTELAC
jgi:hypothetical protein